MAAGKKADLQPSPSSLPSLPPELWGSFSLSKKETAIAIPYLSVFDLPHGQVLEKIGGVG